MAINYESDIVYNIDVDFHSLKHLDVVYTKQYDENSRYIVANVWKDSEIYTIPDGAIAIFACTKRDNTGIFNQCIIENNQIIYPISLQTTILDGNLDAEFRLYKTIDNGDGTTMQKLLSTPKFKIRVDKSALDDNTVISTNEFNALTDAMNSVGDLIFDMNDAISRTETATTNANTATTNANTATTNANNAANLANEKAGLADTATQNAITATNNAIDATSDANTAITNAQTATTNANNAATNANDKATIADTAATNANNIATQLEAETLKIFKPAVSLFTDLATAYPTPENGWTVTVNGEVPVVSYRYNGTEWVNLGVISSVDKATNTTLGIVKGGGNVDIDANGVLNAPEIGDLTQLQTVSNTDLVGAINEVDTNIGDKTLLSTTDKSSLVGAINENTSQLASIAYFVRDFKQAGDTDDTASINRALAQVGVNGGGRVKIPWRLTPYVISDELLIYSNTHLDVDETATIKLANGANKIILGNGNKTTQSNLTIIDKNIKVTGGIWDGNRPNQTLKWYGEPNVSNLIVGCFFSGVENLVFKPNKIINTVTYGALFSNVYRVLIENVDVAVGDVNNPNNCDGLHVLGPANDITIQNCKIRSEDNCIAFNADDVSHGQYGTVGDITKVVVNNIVIDNYDGGQGMRLLSAIHKVHDVHISNITGTAGYVMLMSTIDYGVGDFDNITIENVNLKWYVSIWKCFMVNANVGVLNLKNIKIDGFNWLRENTGGIGNICILLNSTTGTPNCVMDRVNIENFTINNMDALDGYQNVVMVDNTTTVKTLRITGLTTRDNLVTTFLLTLSSSTITELILSDLDIDYTNNVELRLITSTITNLYRNGVVVKSFTPIITGITSAGTCTYLNQTGQYAKNGKNVTFEMALRWNTHTGTGQMVVNLPSVLATTSVDFHPTTVISNMALATGQTLVALISKTGSRVQFYTVKDGLFTAYNVPATGEIYVSGAYVEL
jgi:hypothetical protein